MVHSFLCWPPTPRLASHLSQDEHAAPASTFHTAIVPERLNVPALRNWVDTAQAGAILLFEGTVRSTSHDRADVIALEYEVKASMADKVIASILAETAAKIPVERIAVAHRQGRCELGEPTILIAVSAGHRDEAYRASRILIDRIKHEAPIWKREIFSDGTGAWSEGCTACSHPHYHPAPTVTDAHSHGHSHDHSHSHGPLEPKK